MGVRGCGGRGRWISSWGGLRPALPVPAGGIQVETAAQVVEFYGRDSMLLVGGSLQVGTKGLLERSRRFVETVREAGAPLPAKAEGGRSGAATE